MKNKKAKVKKVYRDLVGGLILVLSIIVYNCLVPFDSAQGWLIIAWMPIAMGAGALLKGATSLMSDSPEEQRNKQRKRLMEALMAQIKRNQQSAGEEKVQSGRRFAGMTADRRNVLNQKLSEYGMDPVGSIASNEKDLVEGGIQERAGIDQRLLELNNLVQGNIDQVGAGMEDEESDISRFLGNAIEGANMGANFGQALGFLDPKVKPALAGGGSNMLTTGTGPRFRGDGITPSTNESDYGWMTPGESTFSSGNLIDINKMMEELNTGKKRRYPMPNKLKYF